MIKDKDVLDALKNTDATDALYNKMDIHQKEYFDNIFNKAVTIVDAKAGTGKTTIAVSAGLSLLRQGKVDSITYVRFTDKRYGKMGFLPGDKDDKEQILMFPFYDACIECGLGPDYVDCLIDHQIIELTTDISMRGRNLKRTFLIIDEAQNGSLEDLRLVLTRLHDSGKCVLIGHSGQMDVDFALISGLTPFQIYQQHLLKKSWAVQVNLPINYRGKISQWADDIDKTLMEISKNNA